MRIELLSRWLVASAAFALVACGGAAQNGATSPPVDVGSGQLQGAGATFPEPFYTRAFYAYNQKYNQVSVNYQAIGSGGGIQQFTKGTVDFGASDVPMTDAELAAAGGPTSLIEFPSIVGVAAIAYNLQGVDRLQLDGPTLANIYLGNIKKWDDPAIKALNSSASLPSKDIAVVHRSDSSGTSYMFTDYLSKVSPAWASGPGKGKAVNWPVGVGAPQNAGVGQAVKTTDGAIGYVELAYVIQSNLQYAYLKNSSGKYLQAGLAGATAAAASNSSPSPTNFSITNSSDPNAYPIASFSWVFVRTNQTDATKGKAVVYLWKWVVTDGESYGKDLQYASLPKDAQSYSLAQLKTVTSGGKAILS